MFPYPIALPKNYLLAAIHLVTWLLWHPTAWKIYLSNIDNKIPPDFSLLHLSYAQWKEPAIQKLLVLAFVILPILVALFTFLIAYWFNSYEKALSIASYILMITLTSCWVGSITLSFVFGIVFSTTIGLLLGSYLGFLVNVESIAIVKPMAIVVGIALFSLSLSINCFNQLSTILMPFRYSEGNSNNSLIISIVLIIGILSGALFFYFIIQAEESIRIVIGKEESFHDVQRIALKTISLLMLFAAFFWLKWKTHLGNVKPFSVDTIFIILIFIVFIFDLSNKNNMTASSAIYGITDGVFYVALFTLPFLIFKEIAGTWIGGYFAVLISSFFIVTLIEALTAEASVSAFIAVIVGIAAGLFFHQWRAVLFYLMVIPIHLILFKIECNNKSIQHSMLRYHAALWDEKQWIPLIGLGEHIILARKRHPEEVERVLAYLNTTKQYWVTHEINLILDGQLLHNCKNVSDISQSHQKLVSQERIGDATSEMLRIFKRISQEVQVALHQEEDYVRKLNLTNIIRQLDDLIRELHRTNGKYMRDYQDVAIKWRELIHEHIQSVRNTQNIVDIPNLYVTGIPLKLNHPLFVGRREIINEIERLLLDDNSPALVLFGQRRMGKTSLLYNINLLLANDFLQIIIDLQGICAVTTKESDFFYSFARNIFASIRQNSDFTLSPISREECDKNPVLYLDNLFDEIEHHIGNRHILLMLDELMSLEYLFETKVLQAQTVLSWLRSQIQHRTRLKVLLSDSHPLTELKHWATYLINVQIIRISFLTRDDTYQLIEKPMPNFPLCYHTDAVERILKLTFCHPALVQLLCYNIVKLKNQQSQEQKFVATIEEIDIAAANTLEQGQFYFADIENQLNLVERDILCVMAQCGENVKLTLQEIMQLCPACQEKNIQRLLDLELIGMINNGDHAQYYIQVELIRRYFAKFC